MFNYLKQRINQILSIFWRAPTADEITIQYSQKLVPLVYQLRSFAFDTTEKSELQRIFAQGEDYVEIHSSHINAILSSASLTLKAPAGKLMYDLRWQLARMDPDEYLIAQNKITESINDFHITVDQLIKQKFVQDVLTPISEQTRALTGTGTFGDPLGGHIGEA